MSAIGRALACGKRNGPRLARPAHCRTARFPSMLWWVFQILEGEEAMPNSLRFLLSIVAALAAVAAFFVEIKFGIARAGWIVALLGAMMVGALWLFPDVSGKHEKE